LVWHRTERIEECPACGSLLWDSAVPAEAPEDTEAVDFLSLLFSASAARRRQARASLPWELELWSEGDLLELFEVLGLLSDPELLMRMPREGSEIWLRAVGIHAALAGIPSIRDLLALAFDDPPINADRFWSTRRMTLTNAAIQRSRSPQVRDFLTKQMRSLL
jgi:hypothetical protein